MSLATQRFNVLVVPKDPGALSMAPCRLGHAVDRERAYFLSHRFIAARYPNDQDLVNELAGEDSPLYHLKQANTGHVVVAVDADEYLVVTQN